MSAPRSPRSCWQPERGGRTDAGYAGWKEESHASAQDHAVARVAGGYGRCTRCPLEELIHEPLDRCPREPRLPGATSVFGPIKTAPFLPDRKDVKLVLFMLVLALAAGFLTGGRFAGLSSLRIRLAPLAVVGL